MNIFSFYPYITIQKLVNLALVYLGYWYSVITKKGFVWGYPIAASVETSALCNLRCPGCPTGNNSLGREQGHLSYHDFSTIINQIKKHCLYLNLSLQGEPFLNKDIIQMIQYANDNKIYTSLSTNGHFLDSVTIEEIISSGLQRIIISLDGASQQIYEHYRIGGSFKKVIEGINRLSDLKKQKKSTSPEIVLQFIVFRYNEHQTEEIKRLGKNVGANKVVLKSAQLECNNENEHLVPLNKKYSRYNFLYNELKIKSFLHNRCFRIWETLVITWDGTVIPCCFDKSAIFRIGNIQKETINSIWKSLLFNNFRKKSLQIEKNRSFVVTVPKDYV